MFTLFSAAMAMDCTGLDSTLCEVVDDLEFRIEAITNTDVIGPDKATRFQPITIYNQLDTAREAIAAGGCRTDEAFEGYEGGSLSYTFPGGSFEGSWSTGGTQGTTDGTVNVRKKTVAGDYDGDEIGLIGDSIGRFNDGVIFGSRDDGFQLGYWIRQAGRTGIYVSLFGQCDTGEEIDASFDAWFPGALEATCSDDDTVLSFSNGSCLDCGAGYTLETDPQIFWRLNETSGTTVTNLGSAGATEDGEIVGTLTLGVDGVGDDLAISNDGSGTNERIRSTASTFGTGSELSTSIWLRTSNTQDRSIFSYAVSSGNNNAFLLFRPDNLQVYLQSAINVGGNVADGEWHHVVVTFVDNGQLTVYIDGVQTHQSTQSTRSVAPGGTLVLFQEQDSVDGGFAPSQEWLGELDEVATWDRILTANEVENLYRSATCSTL